MAQPSYADDFSFSHSTVKVAEFERRLQDDLDAVVAWANKNSFE